MLVAVRDVRVALLEVVVASVVAIGIVGKQEDKLVLRTCRNCSLHHDEQHHESWCLRN